MLLHRTITALILIPLVICGIYFVPLRAFYGATVVIVAWSAWEWSRLIPCRRRWQQFGFTALTTGLYLLVFWLPILLILIVGTVFWLMAIPYVMTYPRKHPACFEGVMLRTVKGILCIIPCWVSVSLLRSLEMGSNVLLFFLVLVWSADIGAYFSGKSFGKTKLAPAVSPGKTTEGVLGGLLLAVLVSLLGYWLLKLPNFNMLAFMLFAVIVTAISVVGDLFISVQKRSLGIKDVGQLLPGHGGFLDRVDGMMAAAPVFALMLMVFGLLH